MFDDSIFENWLDEKSRELINKIGNGQSLTTEEMIILVLKAQSNHFYHLDKDLREDMELLRKDTTKQIKDLREDTTKQIKDLREDMDKRFEQVDKRFEQVDKRFEILIARMDRFMLWSLGITLTSTLFIVGMMYKFMH